MAKSKVMVAIRDAESVESLMKLACQMGNGMDRSLIALHVVEIPMATPLDATDEALDRPGKQILSLARRIASECFAEPVSVRVVRARQAGETIVDEVKEQGIDLLVMGYRRPRTMAGFLLGSSFHYIACHAPCRRKNSRSWEALALSRLISARSRRLTGTWATWSRTGSSGVTSITARTSFPSPSRPCVNGPRVSPSSSTSSPSDMRNA